MSAWADLGGISKGWKRILISDKVKQKLDNDSRNYAWYEVDEGKPIGTQIVKNFRRILE
jgi:hypothetical protein